MSGEMLGAAPQAMGGWNSSLQGKVLKGHYRIEKKIAQGGMSWLYLVTHVLLEEQMALKLLYPHLLEDPLARQRFIAEAQIQFRLQHPNIVHVTEIIAEPNLLGIVQEWISGPSLKTYLRGCRELLSLGKIWSCAKAVLDALQYAHEQGVVHRDIKPSNILLQEKWGIPGLTPKLSDFGVAKMMGAEHGRTATGTMIGTFNYIAPEQIRNGKTADERSDIYGMGVMLYQLTTGRLPFLGSFERLMFQHLTEEPEDPCKLNPALPPEVGKIVLRCMSKKPEERYRSCRALSEALEQCCPEPEILFPHPRRQKQFMRSPSQQFPRTPSQIGRGQEHGSASFERAYDSSQSSYLFDSSQSFAGGAPRASGPDDSNAILQKDPFSEMFKDQQFHRDDTRERIKQANAEGVAEELELPSKPSIEDMPQSLELSPREEGKEEEGLWSGGHLSHRISKSLKIPKFQKNDSLELDLLAGEGENGGDKHDEDKNVPEEPIFSEPQVVVRPESLPVVLSDESSALWDDQAGGSSASSRFIPIVLIVLLALAGGVWFFVGGQKPDPQNKPSKQRGIAVARTLEPRTPPTGSEPRVPADRGAEPGSNKPVLVPGGACKNGKTRSCFGGARALVGKGRCKAGIQRCRDGKWGACEGALLPRQERCNGIDDDCDGRVDEAFANKGKRCVIKDGACRFQGRWTCHRSGRKLRCGNAKTYLGRGRPIKIRMTPSRVRFRLRVGGVNYRARRQFCVGGRAGQKLTISASGYQLCVASLRGRSMRLKMKVKSEIEDAPGYCVR